MVVVRFGNIDPTAWTAIPQFCRELSVNEAHSSAYLLHHEDFIMPKKEVPAKMKDLRAYRYYSDPLILFENFSANVDSVHNNICFVIPWEAFAERVLEIEVVELAHR